MAKQKQIRMTLHDCLTNQEKLRELLKMLINEKRCLSPDEKLKYYEILPNALLSQGATDPVYFVYKEGWFIFESVQTLAQRMADLSTDTVHMKTTKPKETEITISISELWKFLYRKILYLFPQANAEAIHISAESIERQQQKSFTFTSKEDLK
jgi:hypothetical protein